jgi:anti-anti-sigma regulatory factor
MNPFHLESIGSDCRLRLAPDVTIEHARELHAALVAALPEGTTLQIDAGEVTRLDAAIVQLLLAATRVASRTEIKSASAAWTQAFERFGFVPPVISTSRVASA